MALLLFAIHLAKRRHTISDADISSMIHGILTIPHHVESLLKQKDRYRSIAKQLFTYSNMLYLGRGIHFPIALEGALKLKEISYIHAEGYAAGEMKHGPIALIDEHMPVILIVTKGAHYEKILGNLEEVRARQGKIIALATVDDVRLKELAHEIIEIPDVPWYLQPFLTIIPLQLLAYYIADLRGTDVDQPRNLAKSVTVE
jgi:glucosamine--fructose-6-phosphate aminotransferase (isomerizing)